MRPSVFLAIPISVAAVLAMLPRAVGFAALIAIVGTGITLVSLSVLRYRVELVSPEDIRAMDLPSLRSLCRAYLLDESGTLDELRQRILRFVGSRGIPGSLVWVSPWTTDVRVPVKVGYDTLPASRRRSREVMASLILSAPPDRRTKLVVRRWASLSRMDGERGPDSWTGLRGIASEALGFVSPEGVPTLGARSPRIRRESDWASLALSERNVAGEDED